MVPRHAVRLLNDFSRTKNTKFHFSQRTTPIAASQRISIKDDGTLEISAVRAADVGQYICMVNKKKKLLTHTLK
jgi:hypothetical protein